MRCDLKASHDTLCIHACLSLIFRRMSYVCGLPASAFWHFSIQWGTHNWCLAASVGMRSSFISGATIVRKLSFGLIFFIMLLAFGAQAQDDEIIVIEHRGYIDSSFYFKEYTVTPEAGQ